MPSSEDYTIVWAGIYYRLKEDELEEASKGTHPLIRSAREGGLKDWYDTFEIDPVEGDIYCILIGHHIATLGYKEGQTRVSLSKDSLQRILYELEQKFNQININQKPELHVFVHIENNDD